MGTKQRLAGGALMAACAALWALVFIAPSALGATPQADSDVRAMAVTATVLGGCGLMIGAALRIALRKDSPALEQRVANVEEGVHDICQRVQQMKAPRTHLRAVAEPDSGRS